MLLVWSVSFLLLAGVSHQCHVFWQHVPHHLQKIQQVLWPPGNPASLAVCGPCLSWKPWFLHCSWMSVCSVFSRATVSHLLLADRVCIFMFLGVVSACSSLLTFAFYPCVALKTSGSWQVSYFMAEAKEIPWKWVLCKAETLVESLVFIFFLVSGSTWDNLCWNEMLKILPASQIDCCESVSSQPHGRRYYMYTALKVTSKH